MEKVLNFSTLLHDAAGLSTTIIQLINPVFLLLYIYLQMKKNPSAIFSPRILAKALGVMIKGKPKNNEMPQATPTPTPLSNSSSLSTDRSTASGVIASLTASSLSLHESVGVFKGVALAVEPKGHTALTA